MSVDLSQVTRAINNLGRELNNVSSKVDQVGGAVNDVSARQHETRTELGQLREMFVAFVHENQRRDAVQLAETRLDKLQGQMEADYGHYKVVRRSASGMLQAFDVGLVSEETVSNISEQLMIQTPRYWLAPALVALAAWAGDDEELCRRAVEEAHRRDPGRTGLFFALVTRRQGRLDASVRWLRTFLASQDPTALGRHFAVVLESLSQGAFGPAGRALATETLGAWREQLTTDDSTAAQVTLWTGDIARRALPSAKARYPHLAVTSPQWPLLEAALSHAGVHGSLLEQYGELLHREIPPSSGLEDAVDDILDQLVAEYDPEELPLRRDIVLQEAIVAHHGDLDAARISADLTAVALDRTLDYLTIQTMSALKPAEIGVSDATKRIAVSGCADWFQAASDQHAASYRSKVPNDVTAVFDTQHTVGAATFNLPKWSASFQRPMAELEQSLRSHWESHTKPFVDSLRYDRQRALIIAGAVCGAVFILLAVLGGLACIVGLVAFGIWALVIQNRASASAKAVAEATRVLDSLKQESVQALRASGSELVDWQDEFRKADALSGQVDQLIDGYRTYGGGATPFENRSIA